jgi:hypothetical protein
LADAGVLEIKCGEAHKRRIFALSCSLFFIPDLPICGTRYF